MKDAYAVVSELIIEKLEEGTIPWKRPWHGGAHRMPRNLTSKRKYRGINCFLLDCLGYAEPYFLTFNQVKKLGGKVIKGSKSCPVILWKWLEIEEEDENGELVQSRVPFLRFYRVFNVLQCEGIDYPKVEVPLREHDPVEAAEAIVEGYPNPPTIDHGQLQASYSPSRDVVSMPDPERFLSGEAYYSTFFHELAHSSGHKDRLNRTTIAEPSRFGSEKYSQEELVAEFGAAFLCAHAGIDNSSTVENSTAYIQGWLEKLKSDKRLAVIAAAQAQKAADWILDSDSNDNDNDNE